MSRAPCIWCMTLLVILGISVLVLAGWICADVAARIERERWRDACNAERPFTLTLSSHHVEHYVCRRVQ